MTVYKKRQNKTPLYIDNELHEKLDGYKDKLFINEYRLFATIVCDLDLDLKRNNISIDDLPRLYHRDYHVTPKYEVGQYYTNENKIMKVLDMNADSLCVATLYLDSGLLLTNGAIYRDSDIRSATLSEVKIFNRAEQFHKQNRRLNEFEHGDVVRRAQGEPFYFREIHEGEEPTFTLICTKEKRGDL
ncbi:hypothetical protein HBP99_04120 [Listeria booriae]|uniref:hypothetical protein n=1 Tax=Listeria booriae TaxID=1552123 RepID=UPI0016297642|nr:hypothetical protein [Listeria booriae]MBC2367806.1 hypothetical protein [Listeria booriae]